MELSHPLKITNRNKVLSIPAYEYTCRPTASGHYLISLLHSKPEQKSRKCREVKENRPLVIINRTLSHWSELYRKPALLLNF